MPFRRCYSGLIDRYRDRLDSRAQRWTSSSSSKASFPPARSGGMAVTNAVEEGSPAIGCASTGNPAA